MRPFPELLAVDHHQTLEFFVEQLQDVCEPHVDRHELLYNASLLAHYAQVSTQAAGDVPTPASLSEVFDQFVATTTVLNDALMMEAAGAQCLLLAGFFEDQMQHRHNVRWYAQLGAGFFRRAARRERSSAKARLLDAVSRRFEPWRRRHALVSRELRAQSYLLTSSFVTPPVNPELKP